MARIHLKTNKSTGKTYYYFRNSYRVKIGSDSKGKSKGSGKSKVITEEYYLGTAEDILKKCRNILEPSRVYTKRFGLEMALYSVAQEISVIDIINEVCPDRINGVGIGEYIVTAAINRVGHHHSKSSIGQWFSKTKLPEVMKTDPKQMTSDNYWKAYDQLLPQERLDEQIERYRHRRKQKMTASEQSSYLLSSKLWEIEKRLYQQIMTRYNLSSDAILYDTTNFHHYISSGNQRCILPQTSKSKDGKTSNRLTGLILAVESSYGIPLFHSIYQANHHDSSLFPEAMTQITRHLSEFYHQVDGYVVVFDKGNNSASNFEKLSENELIKSFVGSISFSNFKQFRDICHDQLNQEYSKWRYTELEAMVFNRKAKVVMTYSEIEKNHQLNAFEKRIEEVHAQIREAIANQKSNSESKIKKMIDKKLNSMMIKSSKAGRYIGYEVIQQKEDAFEIRFKLKSEAAVKKKEFGKRLLFSYDLSMPAEQIIRLYHDKYKIEDVFRNFKGGDIIKYSPIYHWTDSKIAVQAFVNVLAYLLIKLIEKKLRDGGIDLSISKIVEILKEIEEVVLIYSPKIIKTKITELSKIHKQFIEELNLCQFNSS